MRIERNRIPILIIFILFGCIYSLISLVNHYTYRTYALDLGMFNHALYSFSHFRWDYFTLDLSGAEVNYFGDHFSPITILFSPLYYIFGSATLLLVQIASILFGGWGIYKYVLLKNTHHNVALILLIQFFCIWGIYSALSFDYHNNVPAAMLIPWLFYYYEKQDRKMFLLFFCLILSAKENMALWMAFILAGIVLKRILAERKINISKYLRFEIPFMLLSFIYFIVVVGKIMPAISHGEGFNQLERYSHLGGSLSEIIKTIFTKPAYIFSLLYKSSLNEELYFGIKSELHSMVLVSGGFALLFRPAYLVMLIPIYAQKLLTNDYGLWGINVQYSIEFAPILTLCLADFLSIFKNRKTIVLIAVLVTLLTAVFSFSKMEKRKSIWYKKQNTAFYSAAHFHTDFDIKEMNNATKQIPAHASLSVNSPLAPRLSFRDKIYHFPVIKDAEYIALLRINDVSYPLTQEEFDKKIDELLKSGEYKSVYDSNKLLILKRKM